jgi:hypothetical protein
MQFFMLNPKIKIIFIHFEKKNSKKNPTCPFKELFVILNLQTFTIGIETAEHNHIFTVWQTETFRNQTIVVIVV